MPSRPSWKGYLKLSLVSVPVVSYSAVNAAEGEIHFHQLHDRCKSRIKYVKTCPLHGAVPPEEIVSGYEFDKDRYIVVDKGELASLRSAEEKSVELEAIIDSHSLDPIYLTDRIHYLVPDGRIGQKPYAVIEKCLRDQKRAAIGRRVVNGKDEVVLIWPLDQLLVMTTLSNAVRIREPETFAREIEDVTVSAAEMKLTRTLLDAFYQESVDLSQFNDEYDDRLAAFIEAKVQGKKVVTQAAEERTGIINLMDALRKSINVTKPKRTRKPSAVASDTHQIKRAIVARKTKKAKRA